MRIGYSHFGVAGAAVDRRVTCMAVPLICYKWKRSERAKWCNYFAEASESDNKEADHKRVNCVGLIPFGDGKDRY